MHSSACLSPHGPCKLLVILTPLHWLYNGGGESCWYREVRSSCQDPHVLSDLVARAHAAKWRRVGASPAGRGGRVWTSGQEGRVRWLLPHCSCVLHEEQRKKASWLASKDCFDYLPYQIAVVVSRWGGDLLESSEFLTGRFQSRPQPSCFWVWCPY